MERIRCAVRAFIREMRREDYHITVAGDLVAGPVGGGGGGLGSVSAAGVASGSGGGGSGCPHCKR